VGAGTVTTCDYAVPFTAVAESHDVGDPVMRRKVYGVQCHPEKSGRVGLIIVRNFIEKVC